jgi:hypothetical protein
MLTFEKVGATGVVQAVANAINSGDGYMIADIVASKNAQRSMKSGGALDPMVMQVVNESTMATPTLLKKLGDQKFTFYFKSMNVAQTTLRREAKERDEKTEEAAAIHCIGMLSIVFYVPAAPRAQRYVRAGMFSLNIQNSKT